MLKSPLFLLIFNVESIESVLMCTCVPGRVRVSLVFSRLFCLFFINLRDMCHSFT